MYKLEFFSPIHNHTIKDIISEYSSEYFVSQTEQLKLFDVGQENCVYFNICVLLNNLLHVEEIQEKLKTYFLTEKLDINIFYTKLETAYNRNYNYYQHIDLNVNNFKPGNSEWR